MNIKITREIAGGSLIIEAGVSSSRLEDTLVDITNAIEVFEGKRRKEKDYKKKD